MKKTAFRAAAVAALVTPALLLGPAADADIVKGKAPVKSGVSKATDITFVKLNNAKKSIVFTVSFRSLKINKASAIVGVARQPGRKARFLAGVARKKKGAKLRPVFGLKNGNKIKPRKCKGLRFKKSKNKVVIKVPQKCYGKAAGSLYLGASADPFKGKSDGVITLSPVKRG